MLSDADQVTFLRARLDGDRHRSAYVHNWACDSWPEFRYEECNCGEPARVRAEVEAKRRILDHAEDWAPTVHIAVEGWTDDGTTAYRMAMDWVLGQLVSVYKDEI